MKLTMDLGPRSYDIILKRGVLPKAHLLVNLRRKVLLATDSGVPKKYTSTLAAQCAQPVLHVLQAGEANKTLQAAAELQSHMLREGFGPHDVVAAVGGGTVGDIAGFAAATYMRGVSIIHFPTTTTAQCDSAIGGLCNLDLDGAKNVLGAFHQPEKVIIDPNLLKTLPPRYYAAGLAEALKVGLLAGPDLFELLETGDVQADIERILGHALLLKKNCIEQDPGGKGLRQLLRFGNFLGQAIEGIGAPDAFLHGEAVALGMLPFIEPRTLLRRTRAVMRKLGLPLKHPYTPAQIWPLVQNDAGREGDIFTLPQVKKLGEGVLEPMEKDDVALLLKGK